MNWFNNLKITSKLLITLIILSTITAFIGIEGIRNMSTINNMLNSLYTRETLGISYIKEADVDLIYYGMELNNFLLATTKEDQQKYIDAMDKYEAVLNKNIESARPLLYTEKEKTLLVNFEESWKDYYIISRQVMAYALIESLETKRQSVHLAQTKFREKGDTIESLLSKLSYLKEENGRKAYYDSDVIYADSRTFMILLTIGAIASGLGVGFYISRIISKPINKLLVATNKFSSGDLNITLVNNSKDELGELTTAFNNMTEKAALQIQYLDNIPNPVMIIDTDFNIQYMNKDGAKVVCKDQKLLAGQKCYDQFKTDHCHTEKCALYKAMKSDSIVTEETIAHPNGTEIPILYTGAPVKNKVGKIIGALESVTDIKEIKDGQNYLNRSTRNILHAMDKFADGDLTVSIMPEKENDDIGKLFHGFNKSVQNIGNIIAKINEAVAATASASTQISSSTEEMAAGSQEQSSQSQEVAAAVDEMTKTILDTTKNANITSDEAKNAGKIAKEGGKVISETVEGMNRIANVVTKAAETVQELGKNSDQIGEIIQVIDDIADQTNLLALNAAIEAARAGEQGRGFAVVADEVRKLAERTTKATKEIADMIKRIQKDTNGAVESIQLGTKEVLNGKVLAAKAGESLEQIISGSNAVVDRAMQVAAASEEQSASAEQISKNIEAISSVIQQSAAGTQQIARAAEDLNKLTENLQGIISKFKISSYVEMEKSKFALSSNGRIVNAK